MRKSLVLLLSIAALGGAIAEAQAATKVYRIGLLEPTSPSVVSPTLGAFRQGIRELGWVEGQNLAIEYRWAEGRNERFPELAAELVRLKVDVILTRTTPAALAAKNATRTIPIVMAASGDPVGTGLIASLARPGGNITGLSSIVMELGGKWVQLLKEAFPKLSRVAFLDNPTNPATVRHSREVKSATRSLGITLEYLEVRKPDDFERTFQAVAMARADALIIPLDTVFQSHRAEIVDFAARQRLPAIYASREFVEGGGLMSYGVNFPNLYHRAAIYVDKILRGTKPADLPVEQPTKLELVINLRTAKALGVKIPAHLLMEADKVIE